MLINCIFYFISILEILGLILKTEIMKKIRTMFMYMLCAIATVSFCSCGGDDDGDNNASGEEFGSNFNIVGNWYVSQCWGKDEWYYTDVYEYYNGDIKEIERPENISTWDDSYDYGKNIISFREDETMIGNTITLKLDFLSLCTGYVLDVNNRKLTFISRDGKTVYDVFRESDAILLSFEEESNTDQVANFSGYGNASSGLLHHIIKHKYTRNIKLIKMN